MPIVSIIVPVYNTEKYLSQCIDSILSQTFIDYELILVNDGSTDNSGKICDEYATKDNRIVVIHKENGGANKAREAGVIASNCEWVIFVDSDDIISKNAIETLYNNINDDIDIVIGQIEGYEYIPQTLNIDNYRKSLLRSKYPGPVARIIKKSLFNNKTFDIPSYITIGEDLLMNIRLSFSATNSVVIIPDVIYKYRFREDSTYHSHKDNYEYYEYFFKSYINSIPSKDINKYQSEIFYFAYDKWSNFCGYSTDIASEWKQFGIYKYVMQNFKFHRDILRKYDFILLNSSNYMKIIKSTIILFKKLHNRIKISHV